MTFDSWKKVLLTVFVIAAGIGLAMWVDRRGGSRQAPLENEPSGELPRSSEAPSGSTGDAAPQAQTPTPAPARRTTTTTTPRPALTSGWYTYKKGSTMSFEYPSGWRVTEVTEGFQVVEAARSANSILIQYGVNVATRTGGCYPKDPPTFPYWKNFYLGRTMSSIITPQGLSVGKYLAPTGNRYYACVSGGARSLEAVTFGVVPERTFDHVVQTFRF